MNSSQSMAMAMAWRSLRVRSDEPPTTPSSQLTPRYRIVVSTEVRRRMPLFCISSVSPTSPSTDTRTAWSKVSLGIAEESK